MAMENKMNVLLLGSGGRESAIAHKLSQSSMLRKLWIAPGNGGTTAFGDNIALSLNDFDALAGFCVKEKIDMLVVGPEEPLVKGIADFFQADEKLRHIKVVGPGRAGAQLEGSKAFSKAFMQRHRIPTAAYAEFDAKNLEQAWQYLERMKAPYVIKADGLAAGKGVLILDNLAMAKQAVREIFNGKFGAAGHKVVIEEFLQGLELSVFALTDGKDYVLLPSAKDYKRVGEGDNGLNTGGMGAISPAPFADELFMHRVEVQVIRPTIAGLQAEGIPYKGFLFFGLMNAGGHPYVIEYNCRMGDPETEVVMPRLDADLLQLFVSLFDGSLAKQKMEVNEQFATTVMLVSGGYPENYQVGYTIQGLENLKKHDVFAYHAATKIQAGECITAGGRVMAITAMANDLSEALAKCYKAIDVLCFKDLYYRKDIGFEFLPSKKS